MKRIAESLVVACALALALAAPREARACSPVPPRWPRLTEPLFEDSRVDIESESLDLACEERGRDAACTLQIKLRIHNGAAFALATRGAVLSSRGLSFTVEPSGAAPLAVYPADVAGFLSAVPRWREVWEFVRRASAFDVKVGAGESLDLVVRSAFVMERFVNPCFHEGIEARHPVFAAGRREGDFELLYFHSNAARRLRRDRIDVHVRRPLAWEGEIGSIPSYEDDMRPPDPVSRRHGPAEESASPGVARAEAVYVELTVPRSVIWGGGPFLGAGYGFGPAGDRGLRLRLGYELAAPVWLLHSLAMETDAHRIFSIVPASELVTGSQSMSPLMLGLGVGVPVRIRPDTRAGGRMEASASYGWLTLRGTLDVYPRAGLLPGFVEGSLGGQLSL
jgi:hypothetical protein